MIIGNYVFFKFKKYYNLGKIDSRLGDILVTVSKEGKKKYFKQKGVIVLPIDNIKQQYVNGLFDMLDDLYSQDFDIDRLSKNILENDDIPLEYKEIIEQFCQIVSQYEYVNMDNIISNLENLKIIEHLPNDSDVLSSTAKACYRPQENTIFLNGKINDMSNVHTFVHEMLHMCTTYIDKETNEYHYLGKLSFGYEGPLRQKGGNVGRAINEGMTEMISNQITGIYTDSTTYFQEQLNVKRLAEVIGWDKMYEAYFNGDVSIIKESLLSIDSDELKVQAYLQSSDLNMIRNDTIYSYKKGDKNPFLAKQEELLNEYFEEKIIQDVKKGKINGQYELDEKVEEFYKYEATPEMLKLPGCYNPENYPGIEELSNKREKSIKTIQSIYDKEYSNRKDVFTLNEGKEQIQSVHEKKSWELEDDEKKRIIENTDKIVEEYSQNVGQQNSIDMEIEQ